jgi:hypothetical protein
LGERGPLRLSVIMLQLALAGWRVCRRSAGRSAVVSRAALRLWFCLAVAIIGAAIADPMVESASNAGWFGPGNFTDHSTADVIPALLLGCLAVLAYLGLRVRAALTGVSGSREDLLRATGQALDSGLERLLPRAFALQILVLYAMETAEQYIVWGHGLGPTIWLGAPALISLAAHAAVCVVVACIVVGSVRALARATVRVIRFIQAFTTLPIRSIQPLARFSRDCVTYASLGTVLLCGIGERAPPLIVA